MSRRAAFNPSEGWDYPISPEAIAEKTRAGGVTVDPVTGKSPTTGSMVSIPGHEVAIPIGRFGAQDIKDYVTPERKEVLKDPEHFIGAWRSSDDPEIGDAAYADVSKRYPDTPTGSRQARQAAMSGDQWATYNIDRNMVEKNITKPEVTEGIKKSQKIDIPESEVEEYSTSTEPIGSHVALGYRTEPDVIKTRGGRKKTVAGTGQMTFVELGSKAN